MSGISSILETAKQALMAQRVGIGVTGHNIANASTPGFSRQRVSLEPNMPLPTTAGLIGTGVKATQITRMRDLFIDQQIRIANESFGEADVQKRILSQVEAIINEPSDSGLSAAIDRFFNTFQELALHPEESASRNAVIQQGALLTQSFHRINTAMKQLRKDLMNDVNIKVNRINEISEEIARLNVEIINSKAAGFEPGDSMDKRDLLLDELSRMAKITISENDNGSVMVALSGSVIASHAGAVPVESSIVDDKVVITYSNTGKQLTINGGELGGVMQMYNSRMPDYLDSLNQIAGVIINRVNEIHSSGYGLGDPPPTGVDFFTGTNAGDIQINQGIIDNIALIAASADGAPGNNDIALMLSDIPNEPLLTNNTQSIAQKYNGLVSTVGSHINSAESILRSQEMVLAQLELQKSSVSGVSLDEEMTNLIKFQRAFDAAARVVRSVDELFQTIINMV